MIALSAGEVEDLNNDKVLPLVHFRVYKLKSYKSGQNYQELNWMKLVLVLILKLVEELLLLQMLKKKLLKPKQLEAKVKKNVTTDFMGDKVAQIHVGKQDLSKLQTRKMKGLKEKYDQESEEEDVYVSDEEYFGEDIEEPETKRQKYRVII